MMKDKLHKYFNLEAYKQDKSLWVQILINIICLFFICFAVYVSFNSLLLNRSLWYDEAALAYSILTRSFTNLTTEIFDYEQSAPIIYLYIVKTLTLIFGSSEITLRMFSFISYLATLVASYYIAARVLKMKLPILPSTLISVLTIMISYSYELKPYMTDCIVVLSILIVYYLYNAQRLKAHWLIAIYAILIWFSNPSCFFIGSILLIEFIEGIGTKNALKIKFSIICGIAILLSFAIYFFYWLKPVSESTYMINFWSKFSFPLIPTSLDDLIRLQTLAGWVTDHLGTYKAMITLIVISGFFINIFTEKNKYIYAIYGGILLALFASMIGKYPFMDRLFLFIYPLLAILFFYFINKIYTSSWSQNMMIAALSLVIIYGASNLRHLSYPENVFRSELEANSAVQYIQQNIEEGESLYAYYYCTPSFLYRNNFDSLSFGKYDNNVLLGKYSETNIGHNTSEIQRIYDNAPIYLLAAYPSQHEEISTLLDSLRVRGNIQLVHDKYETNVYYYTTNNKDSTTIEKP